MCPYPKYLMDKLLRETKEANVIEVLVDCPSAVEDVPITASRHGYEKVSTSRIKDGEWLIVLKRV